LQNILKKQFELIESILGECTIKTKKGWIPLKEYDICIDDTVSDDRFDKDLTWGEIYEGTLRDVLRSKGGLIEVKTERNGGDKNWDKTGNIYIEYESRGKRSGISTTKANWWVHWLTVDSKVVGGYILPIEYIKAKAREYYKLGKVVPGGDDNTSMGILIPIKELF